MIIYANGCSYTKGQDEYLYGTDNIFKAEYNQSWPVLAGRELGAEKIYNKATYGASARKICDDTTAWIENYPGNLEDVVVLIGLTSVYRELIYLSDVHSVSLCGTDEISVLYCNEDYEQYTSVLPPPPPWFGTQEMLSKAHNFKAITTVFKNYLQHHTVAYQLYFTLFAHLESKGVKYLAFNMLYDGKKFDNKFVENEIVIENTRKEDGHPLKEDQEKFAKHVAEKVRSKLLT